MATGCRVPTGTGICLLYFTSGEQLLGRDENHADPVAPIGIRPNARAQIPDGVDDMAIASGAQ
jgi:hypothetical protein